MEDDILPIPVIPQPLRREAGRGMVIPFIGAGVSRLAGGPSWAEFANGALSSFVEQGSMDHATYAQMQHLSPRIKLSMALEREKQVVPGGGRPIDFLKLLHPTGDCSHRKGRRLYGGLSTFSRRFVTTNYDWWLDTPILLPTTGTQEPGPGEQAVELKPQKRTMYVSPSDFKISVFDKPNMVLHLHGSVDVRESMILTTEHYVRHYANDRRDGEEENRVLTLLDELFERYTCLFIGYGLEELEILEYVISNKRRRMTPQKEVKHFLLQGFFSHERALMRELRTYYTAQCRITMIPYLRDELDWDQLLDVIDHFAREIPIGDAQVSARLASMKELLNG
ncbi:MAG: SIR2 family protein [Alphaproteobacteria bacterium]|nr:SIR2 family protein [Alphaproteobacteria bacterium]